MIIKKIFAVNEIYICIYNNLVFLVFNNSNSFIYLNNLFNVYSFLSNIKNSL